MTLSKQDTLTAVEVAFLSVGSTALTFPRVASRMLGADPDAGATTMLVRTMAARDIAIGALLLHVDSEDERERMLTAAAALMAFDSVACLVAAAKRKISWRGALMGFALGGTVAGFACAYLAD